MFPNLDFKKRYYPNPFMDYGKLDEDWNKIPLLILQNALLSWKLRVESN